MSDAVNGAEQLSAALLAIEDRNFWSTDTFAAVVDLERQAAALGDPGLIARAELGRANMLLRTGDLTGAARQLYSVQDWAVEHGDRRLQARTHMTWANVQRMLGDAAKCLEHSSLAVELLDETATSHMQIWHRVKLGDALGISGEIDAARPHYHEAAEMAGELGQWQLLTSVLNNWAFSEYTSGDFPRAREVADRMQEVAAAHGFDLDPATLHTVGEIQIENGEYALAEQTMQTSIAQADSGVHDDVSYLAEFLLTLARAQRGLGTTDPAQASLDAARECCVDLELHEVLVRVHQEQAELHAARGEFAEAFAAQKVFFAARESLRSKQREAQAQTRQAMFETAEAREEAELFREQARRDPLTGLRNRRYVDEELPALIAVDPDLSVAIADLDHFKRINDQLSHDVGDQVLVQVAKLLETELAAVIPEGFVARLGGEEFLLVLPATPVAVAITQLDGIRRAIGEHGWTDITGELPVTISIGVAGVHESANRSQSAVLAVADRNLYAAKHAGRDRVIAGTKREQGGRAYRDSSAA